MYEAYYTIHSNIFEICATDEAIYSVKVVETRHNSNENSLTKECYRQLKLYFEGKLETFELPLNPKGTLFQQKVWKELQQIPYGETITYKDLAINIKNQKYCRAVGGACHNNPILIIIPCHRVLGSNKSLTGFAAGLTMKEFLLNLEKK